MAKGIITCFSAGNSEYKDITIPTATEVCPDNLVIRFDHANTYGETTADTPTHPKIRVYNADDTLLKTLHICDSTGHYAGKGCYGDDFIMEFAVIDDNDESLAIIKNSDIREKTENYTIKSDDYCEQWGIFSVTTQVMARHVDFNFEFSALKSVLAHSVCQNTPSGSGDVISIGNTYAAANIISGITTSGFNVAVANVMSGVQTSVYWRAIGTV